MHRIVSILPKGEGFSSQQFGAIALCVRDFTRFSRYKDKTTVVGGATDEGFDSIHYVMPPAARWFENRTRAYARGCARVIAQEQASLTEIHNRPVLFNLIGQRASARLALHLHNDPQEMEGTKTPAQRASLLQRSSAIYCVSNFIRERFLDGLPAKAGEKAHVIYNGISIPSTLPAKEKLIVFAGRMTEGKGGLLLAMALALALPDLPDWKAVLIGSERHEAGRKQSAYEMQVAAALAPVATQACLGGFLSHEETLAHFSRAAIAVVPSLWQEPFGRTALEAMAFGCGLISSGQGGLREVTADAALSPTRLTPESLAQAILTLARDENLRASYQRLGRERANYFSIEERTRELDAVREHLLAGA